MRCRTPRGVVPGVVAVLHLTRDRAKLTDVGATERGEAERPTRELVVESVGEELDGQSIGAPPTRQVPPSKPQTPCLGSSRRFKERCRQEAEGFLLQGSSRRGIRWKADPTLRN